jgi:ribosome recycling factor
MIMVQVWDTSVTNFVVKSIQESGLGLNPIPEGNVIRVPIPDLSEERRKDLGKKANDYGENAKISVRNIRRDGNDHFKKLEKETMMSEDESRSFSDEIQKITEEYTKKIDQTVSDKVKEIMTI